jgi:hypothetical protein
MPIRFENSRHFEPGKAIPPLVVRWGLLQFHRKMYDGGITRDQMEATKQPIERSSPLPRPSVVIPVIAGVWLLVRLLLECVFPFIPFATNNSFLRTAIEMPLHIALAWMCHVVGVSWLEHSHWGLTVAIAVLEGIVVGCVVLLVWRVFCRRTK